VRNKGAPQTSSAARNMTSMATTAAGSLLRISRIIAFASGSGALVWALVRSLLP
jgi:hypothetical protein